MREEMRERREGRRQRGEFMEDDGYRERRERRKIESYFLLMNQIG